ncbi:Na(+)-translocating NADH-quinone reductase subunit C [Gallaecimonas kandeliae]|uniref:Na(+)-translocating NADH-quinone reductase subunit C n=1 Tax=Gallaecimonas kandeliae TaxID=3029055 RepID=UPI0026473BE0|nr:Na(+)-translocating NADH-quinone reductase subunit C [Gallaecimonas kandeliae]WKE64891.1 Na(+)-translocating NADH-quinone reductase subunit C [Gallaecimonas kandeliae]
MSNESIGKTIGVVLAISLVCSVVVSGAAVALKPAQQQNKLLDKQQNILSAAGLLKPGMSAKEVLAVYKQHIEPRIVELKTGNYVKEVDGKDAASFDQRKAAKDPKFNTELDPAIDVASLKRRSNYASVYLAKDDAGQVTSVVLPIHGNGLWSMMYAFVAVKTDGDTVSGLTYYEQGETPGLGGEVQNPIWLAKWVGKKLYDDNGKPAIQVVKGGAPKGDLHKVDALSGATLTSNGVQHTFQFWMSDNGYGPYLAKVRNGEVNNG